jgi:hypothetical protein
VEPGLLALVDRVAPRHGSLAVARRRSTVRVSITLPSWGVPALLTLAMAEAVASVYLLLAR